MKGSKVRRKVIIIVLATIMLFLACAVGILSYLTYNKLMASRTDVEKPHKPTESKKDDSFNVVFQFKNPSGQKALATLFEVRQEDRGDSRKALEGWSEIELKEREETRTIELDEGAYEIEMTSPGFAPVRKTFHIKDRSEEVEIVMEFSSRIISITISRKPAKIILLDSAWKKIKEVIVDKGEKSASLTLEKGDYNIKVVPLKKSGSKLLVDESYSICFIKGLKVTIDSQVTPLEVQIERKPVIVIKPEGDISNKNKLHGATVKYKVDNEEKPRKGTLLYGKLVIDDKLKGR